MAYFPQTKSNMPPHLFYFQSWEHGRTNGRPERQAKSNMPPQLMTNRIVLALKAPIMTATAKTFNDIFLNFRKKLDMIFHDDSHEISNLICYF